MTDPPKRTRQRGPNAPGPSPAGHAPLPVRQNATLADFAQQWLKLRDKRTRQADSDRLRDHVLPLLGGVRVRELTVEHVTDVVRKTLAKKGMTVKSARNAYEVFAALLGGIATIAAELKEPAGRLVCVGALVLLGTQTVVNLAMTMGVFPVTGVPLPFVSYGGSSMLASWLLLAVVLHARARQPLVFSVGDFD